MPAYRINHKHSAIVLFLDAAHSFPLTADVVACCVLRVIESPTGRIPDGRTWDEMPG
jgi:hypothetical protein